MGQIWFAMTAILAANGSFSPIVLVDNAEPTKTWVYIGTYTDGGSKGIYRCDFDTKTGQLSAPVLAGEAKNPSFLGIHPNRRSLYAVGEVSDFDFDGQKSGGVSAFEIDQMNGNLTLLNQQPSGGAGPCHIIVDRTGKFVLVANYGGGSAFVFEVQGDGRFGRATGSVHHAGKSVHPQRQQRPHAHSINLDAANRFAFVADLGLDKVRVYRFDAEGGTFDMNDFPALSLTPGAGPRHFAFHPAGKFAYVINELNNTVSVLEYDSNTGSLKEMQTVTTLPEKFSGTNHTAEIQVHPSGKFVYGSNRGHDSIAIFAVDPDTGKLTPKGQQNEGIKTPRNFGIDPSGGWMIVANQTGDSLVVFKIDAETGALSPTNHRVSVSRPVCVKFLQCP